MMMQSLFLVRHGRPVPKEIDPNKPLSDEGKIEVERIADFIRKNHILPDAVYHSGKTRAVQTAEIIFKKLKSDKVPEEKVGISPLDHPSIIAEEINETEYNPMIVGHLPHLARLTSWLVSGNDSESIVEFKPAGTICLQRDRAKKKWHVSWVIFPELLTA